jgi:hypothetical protein
VFNCVKRRNGGLINYRCKKYDLSCVYIPSQHLSYPSWPLHVMRLRIVSNACYLPLNSGIIAVYESDWRGTFKIPTGATPSILRPHRFQEATPTRQEQQCTEAVIVSVSDWGTCLSCDFASDFPN